MICVPELDKRRKEHRPEPLRMMGDADVRLILKYAEALPEGASILEVGPWLGGVTRLLSQHGQVTVVDSFIWTAGNATNYPGVADPEQNFRHIFEANMDAEGLAPRIIETTLPELNWEFGEVDFVVLDTLLDARQLHAFFEAIAANLKPNAKVLIKNAFDARGLEMGAYIDALLGLSIFEMDMTGQPAWCNIAVLTATKEVSKLETIKDINDAVVKAPMWNGFTDPWYGRTLSVFRLAYLCLIDRWDDAIAHVGRLEVSPVTLSLWDSIQPQILTKMAPCMEENAAILSELIWLQSDRKRYGQTPISIGSSFGERLRAYWYNNAGADWLHELANFHVILDMAKDQLINRFSAYTAQMYQNDVVEVGTLEEGGSFAALLAGARTYTGQLPKKGGKARKGVFKHFPTIRLTDQDETLIEAIGSAQVLIIGQGIETGPQIQKAITARVHSGGNAITIIRL